LINKFIEQMLEIQEQYYVHIKM